MQKYKITQNDFILQMAIKNNLIDIEKYKGTRIYTIEAHMQKRVYVLTPVVEKGITFYARLEGTRYPNPGEVLNKDIEHKIKDIKKQLKQKSSRTFFCTRQVINKTVYEEKTVPYNEGVTVEPYMYKLLRKRRYDPEIMYEIMSSKDIIKQIKEESL